MKSSLAAASALLFALAFAPRAADASPAPSSFRTDTGSFLGILDSLHTSILTIVAIPEGPVPPRPGERPKRRIGTGIASDERMIVTTASLAFPRAGSVRILLGEGIEQAATLQGVDRQSNLAVFRIEDPILRPLHRAPPQSLAVGTWVAVISNTAITRPQATLGRVVGRGERVDFPYAGDILEIDAPSYPGTAGGAVINEDGEWVALIVGRGLQGPPDEGARVGAPNGGPARAGVLLAVPVDQVDRIVSDLVKHGAVRRGFLGVRLRRGAALAGDTLGVRVDGVIPGSPAALSGIRSGDLILAFEGQEVRGPEDLSLLVGVMHPGDEAEITILRDSEILPIKVTLGSNVHEAPSRPTESPR